MGERVWLAILCSWCFFSVLAFEEVSAFLPLPGKRAKSKSTGYQKEKIA
jgi:hypothetical protein